jgi:hypothetical protein
MDQCANAIPKSTSYLNDMTREGWVLLEDSSKPKIRISNLKFVSAGEFISVWVLKLRAKEMNANLGQYHAEYILKHIEEVPRQTREKLKRSGGKILFPGTVWIGNEQGDGMMPCILWNNIFWKFEFIPLDDEDFYSADDLLASVRL